MPDKIVEQIDTDDLNEFRHFFDDKDISEEYKDAILAHYWKSICILFEIRIDVNDYDFSTLIQCGQLENPTSNIPKDDQDDIEYGYRKLVDDFSNAKD